MTILTCNSIQVSKTGAVRMRWKVNLWLPQKKILSEPTRHVAANDNIHEAKKAANDNHEPIVYKKLVNQES